MTKLAQFLVLGIVLLAALITAGPTLIRLAGALVPLVVVIGIVVALLRCVWFYTR